MTIIVVAFFDTNTASTYYEMVTLLVVMIVAHAQKSRSVIQDKFLQPNRWPLAVHALIVHE